MAGITLAQAEAKLTAYLTAENDILTRGQSAAIKGRNLTRASLAEVREGVTYWQGMVQNLTRGGIRGRRVVPKR